MQNADIIYCMTFVNNAYICIYKNCIVLKKKPCWMCDVFFYIICDFLPFDLYIILAVHMKYYRI